MTPPRDASGAGGLEVVLESLQVESFPMDKEALDYAIGDLEITDAGGVGLPVRELLDRVPESRFDDTESVAAALRRVIATEADRPRSDIG